jgi:hypothetical protein
MKITCFIAMVFFSLNSNATNYYVAASGASDASSGSITAPFATLQKGISVLKPGETLFVRGGIYNQNVDAAAFVFPSGTSWTSTVNVKAYDRINEPVILRGNGFALGPTTPISYIIIDGFVIDGGGIWISNGAHHIRVQNCELKNTYMNGIEIFWGNNNGLSSDYNEIINNYFHHIGRYDGVGRPDVQAGYGRAHGLYVTTSNNIIRGNTFHDIPEYAVHQWTASPKFADNNLIEGNKIWRTGLNTSRYGHVCCGGITASTGKGAVIRNNIVYDPMVNGIEVNSNCLNCKVYNNTIYNTPGYGIYVFDGAVGVEVRNNISISTGGPVYHIRQGPAVASNNLNANPGFVNLSTWDFHLASTAVSAIDRGVYVGLSYLGSAPDIGAYEFGSGAPTAVKPKAPTNLKAM